MRNLTGDAVNGSLADGLGELLLDRFSRLRWIALIAKANRVSIAHADLDHDRLAAVAGTKYVLDGRLRRDADGFSLAVDLLETQSGHTLWSNRGALASLQNPSALEELVCELVVAVEARIDHAEQIAAWSKPRSDLTVSDLIWRGRWHSKRLTREDSELARALFAEAIAREPRSSEALVQFAWALERTLWARRASDDEIKDLRRLAQQVSSIDADDSRGYMLAGSAEFLLRNPRRAKALLNRAISLNPSLVNAHAYLGSAHNLSGEPGLAISPLETALRLSPTDHEAFYFLGELGMAHSMLGNWHNAIDYADQSLARRGAYWYAHVLKINALARIGRTGDARFALDDLLAAHPKFTEDFIDWLPFENKRWKTHFRDGVGMARGPIRA
jgi:TolB-like protein/Flp pilus assembly protein TadD